MQKALGLIETVGLSVAIEAVDAAMKAANVKLIEVENTRGGGQITVKIEGDVGAVNAAVKAATAAASAMGTVVSQVVIPRPSDSMAKIMLKTNTPLRYGATEKKESKKRADVPKEVAADEAKAETVSTPKPEVVAEENVGESSSESIKIAYTCNICHDPACPRIPGELKTKCIHYND